MGARTMPISSVATKYLTIAPTFEHAGTTPTGAIALSFGDNYCTHTN
jgi:hypothetical protein